MNSKLLIDAIVRQTTVLIAQLSTAAGIRAPLAHVADQVFLELSRELEAQGLGKRVVADMFGMLIRGYQKKVQRLTESASVRDKSLWEAVLEFISAQPGVSRERVLARFSRDDDEAVGSVLRDLGSSGLVFASGQGRNIVYRPTSEADRRALFDGVSQESLVPMLWATIFHNPGIGLADLERLLNLGATELRPALEQLRDEGRVQAQDWEACSGLRTGELLVPVDSKTGWEAAVFDHFQAVSNAIAAKVRLRASEASSEEASPGRASPQRAGPQRANAQEAVGGATLRFELGPDHPHAQQVFGLLGQVRQQVNAVWDEVRAYNAQHPTDPDQVTNVCFYFGQYVTESDDE